MPEANIALQQTALVTVPSQTPQQTTDAGVQGPQERQRQAIVVSSSQDLSSFLTGVHKVNSALLQTLHQNLILLWSYSSPGGVAHADSCTVPAGLRSKYAFQDEGSAQVTEAALQPGPSRPHSEGVQTRQVWSPAQPSRTLAAAAGLGLPGPSSMHQRPVPQTQTQAPTAQVQALPAGPEASGEAPRCRYLAMR